MKPAIELAENGFTINNALANSLAESKSLLASSTETKRFFKNSEPKKKVIN